MSNLKEQLFIIAHQSTGQLDHSSDLDWAPSCVCSRCQVS